MKFRRTDIGEYVSNCENYYIERRNKRWLGVYIKRFDDMPSRELVIGKPQEELEQAIKQLEEFAA